MRQNVFTERWLRPLKIWFCKDLHGDVLGLKLSTGKAGKGGVSKDSVRRRYIHLGGYRPAPTTWGGRIILPPVMVLLLGRGGLIAAHQVHRHHDDDDEDEEAGGGEDPGEVP